MVALGREMQTSKNLANISLPKRKYVTRYGTKRFVGAMLTPSVAHMLHLRAHNGRKM